MKKTLLVITATATLVLAAPAELKLQKIADGLSAPVALMSIPNDPGALLIVDQAGVAHRWHDGSTGVYLDLRGKLTKLNDGFDERGMLDAAFHPEFAENGKLYVYYSAPLRKGAPDKWNHTSHLSEFTVAKGQSKPSLDSERILLKIDQPYFNHDSGRLVFDKSGLLYVSLGDGGGANGAGGFHVEMGNSQDKSQLLGKILRIDVDKRDAGEYGIPSDNPYVGKEGRDEIFALGLRNPWGMSWHPNQPGTLIVADVGQNRFEEINLVGKGDNLGWNIREGFDGFHPKKARDEKIEAPKEALDGQPLKDPVLTYRNLNFDKDNGKGISICGGYVYTGDKLPELKGRYVFGDWASKFGGSGGHIYVADMKGEKWEFEALDLPSAPEGKIDSHLLAIGKDAAGEIYFLTTKSSKPAGDQGVVWKLTNS